MNQTKQLSDEGMQCEKPFSEHECTILRLMCDNYSNKEIADQLFLSKRTIEFYKNRLMIRFGAKNTATLIKRIMDAGLLGSCYS